MTDSFLQHFRKTKGIYSQDDVEKINSELLTELISEVEALKTTTSNYAIYKLGYSEAVEEVIKLLKSKL